MFSRHFLLCWSFIRSSWKFWLIMSCHSELYDLLMIWAVTPALYQFCFWVMKYHELSLQLYGFVEIWAVTPALYLALSLYLVCFIELVFIVFELVLVVIIQYRRHALIFLFSHQQPLKNSECLYNSSSKFYFIFHHFLNCSILQ